jgi:hypothetical protein
MFLAAAIALVLKASGSSILQVMQVREIYGGIYPGRSYTTCCFEELL